MAKTELCQVLLGFGHHLSKPMTPEFLKECDLFLVLEILRGQALG